MATSPMETLASAGTIMHLREYKHIAVVQTAFIGDVVLAFPLLQFLRNHVPQSTLTLVTTPAGAQLAQCIPAISTVLPYDKRGQHKGWQGIRTMARTLREASVQCVLAPHRSSRTTLVARLAHAQCTVGFTRSAFSHLYTQRVEYPYHLHEVERNMQMLSVFSDILPNDLTAIPPVHVQVPQTHTNRINALCAEAGIQSTQQIAVLAPGSVWATKRWPVDHFCAVARALHADGMRVVLSGSRDDVHLCDAIAASTPAVSLAGKTSLPETVALFARATVAVSNDSAPTHIANLVNCPVITIFGPTDPIFGFAPRGAKDNIAVHEQLACRPCAIHGQRECPLGHFACMKGIEPERVIRMVRDSISQ